MELNLEVLSSISIKVKQPWPHLAWMQEYQEELCGLYLFHTNQFCQLSSRTGRINKTFDILLQLKFQVSIAFHSPNGAHLAGLVTNGDMFVWHKQSDILETHLTPFSKMGTKDKANVQTFPGFRMYVSDSGEQVLIATSQPEFYLWEMGVKMPQWWKLFPPAAVLLPQSSYKETSMDAGFFVHQVLDEMCICGVVFNDRNTAETTITHLLINWPSSTEEFYTHKTSHSEIAAKHAFPEYKVRGGSGSLESKGEDESQAAHSEAPGILDGQLHGSPELSEGNATQFGALWSAPPPFNVSWGSASCQSHIGPAHNGKGTYVYRLSPSGDVSALAVNERKAKNIKVLFFSPLTPGELSSSLYPLSREESKETGRTYWIVDMSWTADGLLLACITKRGCLLIIPRFGQALRLVAQGCSVELGPSTHLPIHPLITVVDPTKHPPTDHDNSESSRSDNFRQRFSVAAHPSSSLLACSDGFNLTILRWDASQDLLGVLSGFISDSRRRLGFDDSHQAQLSKGMGDSLGGSRHDIRDFVASIKQGSELPSGYSAKHPGAVFSNFAGLEAGKVHFAGGSGSNLDFGRTLSVGADKESFMAVTSLLQASLGMLLSCEPFVPCNGMLPRTKSLDLTDVVEHRTQIQAITKLLVSAVGKVVSDSSTLSIVSSTTKPEMATMTREFTVSLLHLFSLDKLKQSHMDLSLSVANAVLRGSLSGLVEIHCDFTRLHRDQHTLGSLQDHIEKVTGGLRDIHSLLEEIVYVLESTYSNRPVIFGAAAQEMPQTNATATNSTMFLGSSLKIILNLVCALWNDMKFCKRLAKSIHRSTPSFQMSHDAKQVKNFKSTSSNASITVKALYLYINTLLFPSWYQQSAIKQGPRKDSKPITYVTPNRDIKSLLDKLLQYELGEVIELVNGCIQCCDDETEAGVSSQLDAEQLSDVLNSSVVNRLDACPHVCIKADRDRFIVGALGGVMVAYFTNKKLLVLLSHDGSVPLRHAELSREKLAVVVRDLDVSECWTVERAVNLLLLSGRWEKACNFIVELGDWRKAYVLAAFFTAFGENLAKQGVISEGDTPILGSLRAFSHNVVLNNVLKIISDLHDKSGNHAAQELSESAAKSREQFLSETFRVCASTRMDSVLTSCTGQLLKKMMTSSRHIGTIVHPEFYLPAPPLYCLQLAATERDFVQCPREHTSRNRITHIIHSLLLVLESAHSLQLCAQWYAARLYHAFSTVSAEAAAGIFQVPSSTRHTSFPELLKEMREQGRSEITEGGQVTPAVGHLFVTFRKFCVVLWYLHVRDEVSFHQRKLQPSLTKARFLVEVRKEAAVWSSRLLPFSTFLHHHPDIKDLVLSVLSELPSDDFLANLLAFCFPSPDASRKKAARTKLKRITTRLQVARRQSVEAEPLSAKYQLASGLVLANRAKVFGNDSGGLRKEFLSSTVDEDAPFKNEDLAVGDILCEYDLEYLHFLSTLFTIIIPSSATQSSNSVLPYLSEFHRNDPEMLPSGTPLACSLYPLLNSLMKWAQLPYPQTAEDPAGIAKKTKSKKVAHRRSKLSSSTMRVNLSVPVIVGCLREREEYMLGQKEEGGEDGTTRTLLPSAIQRGSVSGVSDTRKSSLVNSLNGEKERHVRFTPRNCASPIPEENSANVHTGEGCTVDTGQHDRRQLLYTTLQNQATSTPEERFADANQKGTGKERTADRQHEHKSYTVTQNIAFEGKQHREEGGQKEGSPKEREPRSIITEVKFGRTGMIEDRVEIVQGQKWKGARSASDDGQYSKAPKEKEGAKRSLKGEKTTPEVLQHSVPPRDKKKEWSKSSSETKPPNEKEEFGGERSTPELVQFSVPPRDHGGKKKDGAGSLAQHSGPPKEKGTSKKELGSAPVAVQHGESTRDKGGRKKETERAKSALESTGGSGDVKDRRNKKGDARSTRIPETSHPTDFKRRSKSERNEGTVQGTKAAPHPKLEAKEGGQREVTGADLSPNKAEKDAVEKKEASGLQLLQVPKGTLKGHFTPEMAAKTLGVRPISNLQSQPAKERNTLGKEPQKPGTEPELSMMDSELVSAGEFPSDITLSYGEFAPRHRSSSGTSDVYLLSSTLIPDGAPGSYPLSSTVIPGHMAGDGRVVGVAEGVAIGNSRGASNSPDAKLPGVGVNSLDQQSTGLSSSITLSPSSTINADDLCTLSLTEVSQNSTLLAAAESTDGESALAEAAGVQAAGVQASGVQATGVQATGVHVFEKGKGVEAITKTTPAVVEVVQSTSKIVNSGKIQGEDIKDESRLSPPLVTKEDICQIVKMEIEPILQHQHELLLSVLQASKGTGQLEKSQKAKKAGREERCVPQFVPTDGTDGVAAEAYDEETTESTLPPVLELDDLESSSYSEPVAWPSTIGHTSTWRAEPSYHHQAHRKVGTRPPLHSSPSKHKADLFSPSHKKVKHRRVKHSHTDAKHSHLGETSHKRAKLSHPLAEFSHQHPTKQGAEQLPGGGQSSSLQGNTEISHLEAWETTREPRQRDLAKSSTEEKTSTPCTSELCLSDLESNDTVLLSPGALPPTLNPSGTSESSSQPPLLHATLPDFHGDTKQAKIEPFPELCEFPLLQMDPLPQQTASMTGCSLEQAFPDVAENLKMFEQSIVPKWKGFATEQSHLASPSVPKWKDTVPKQYMENYVRMQNETAPKQEIQVGPSSPIEERPFPLLSLPEEVVDFPGLLQVPMSHPLTHQSPPVHQPPSALGPPSQQFLLLPIPPQPYQAPPLPNNQPPCATQHEAPHHPPDLQLPNVPLTPFTPVLVPNLQSQQALEAPKLLKLEDPMTKMKEEGFNFLQLDEVQDRTGDPAQPSRDSLRNRALRRTKAKEAAVSHHVPAFRVPHSETVSESSSASILVPTEVPLERRKKSKTLKKTQHKRGGKEVGRGGKEVGRGGKEVGRGGKEVGRGGKEVQSALSDTQVVSEAYSSKVSSEVETATVNREFLQQRLEAVKKSAGVDVPDGGKFIATSLEKPEVKVHLREEKSDPVPSPLRAPDSSKFVAMSSVKSEEVKVHLRGENLERVPSPLETPAKLQEAVVTHEAKKPAEAAFYPTEIGTAAATLTKSKPSSKMKLPDLGAQSSSEGPSDFPDLFSPLEGLEIRRLNLQSLNREEASSGTSSESDRVVDVTITGAKRDEVSAPEPESQIVRDSSPPLEVATPTDPEPAAAHPSLEITRTVEVEHSLKSTYTKSEATTHSPASPLPPLVPAEQAKPTEPHRIPQSHSPPHHAPTSPSPEHHTSPPHHAPTSRTPEHLTPTESQHSSLEQHSSESPCSSPELPPPSPDHHTKELTKGSHHDHDHISTKSPGLSRSPATRSPPQSDSGSSTGMNLVDILSPKRRKGEKDVKTTPTSSVAVQVGIDVTPPIDLNFPMEDKDADELDIPDFKVVTAGMKKDSGKGGAIERLRQLDEQLRVIESGAKDVEGGLKESNKLLNTIDSLTKVSDALCGVAQSSEGQLNCSPMSMDSKKEEELFRSIISRTPSPFQFSDETSEGSGVRNIEEERGEVEEMEEEEEEEEDEELMGLLRGGGNTISALVLHRPEKWSKEKLRKWVNQRKRKKLKEFTALRSSKGARVRRTPERSPGGVKDRPPSPAVLQEKREAMGEDMRHRRVNEAYSLMTDILASKPVVQPTPSIYSAARPISPKAAAKEQAEKEKEKRRKRERQLTYAPRVAPVSADTVNFKYSLSKKKYKGGRSGFGSEAKSPGSKHAVSASDAMKSAKKVQFSSTQGSNQTGGHGTIGPSSKQQRYDFPVTTMTSMLEKDASYSRSGRLDKAEQMKLAALLDYSDCEQLSFTSVSSCGSVMSNIDWDKVDRILDS